MVKRFNNQFLRDNTCLTTKSQMLFYQKMVELLHAHSGISYSFKSNGVQGVQTRLKRKDRFESK